MKYNQLNIKKFRLNAIDYGILNVHNKPNRKKISLYTGPVRLVRVVTHLLLWQIHFEMCFP